MPRAPHRGWAQCAMSGVQQKFLAPVRSLPRYAEAAWANVRGPTRSDTPVVLGGRSRCSGAPRRRAEAVDADADLRLAQVRALGRATCRRSRA